MWHKKENEFVEAGELLLEIATDKATVEHTALDEGWLRVILIKEGEQAKVNQPIALFTAKKDDPIPELPPLKETQAPQQKMQETTSQASESVSQPISTPGLIQPAFVPEPPLKISSSPVQHVSRLVASPLAKKLAKERGLDLTTIKGSGPSGRIIAKDLEKAQAEGPVAFSREYFPKEIPGSYEEIMMTPMRKAIARRLQESKTFIPHFYVKRKVEVGAMVALRLQLQELQLKVSVNDLIIRACALALRQHPEINRGFNSVTQKIIQFKTIDIAIAVSLEQGLITPILRQCDDKHLGNISFEVKELSKKAREGKLKEEEYKGGSFCISNLGMYGVDEFLAVINPPQAAILAVGGIKEEAMVKEDRVYPGKTLCLTLSADHRVIDGAQAAQFLATLAKFLENPVSLTLS